MRALEDRVRELLRVGEHSIVFVVPRKRLHLAFVPDQVVRPCLNGDLFARELPDRGGCTCWQQIDEQRIVFTIMHCVRHLPRVTSSIRGYLERVLTVK